MSGASATPSRDTSSYSTTLRMHAPPVERTSPYSDGSLRRDSSIAGVPVHGSSLACRKVTGRLAQLGEHLPYKQGVGGSIPSPPMWKRPRSVCIRWLRRQLRQPTPLREHLEAAVENDDPAEARRSSRGSSSPTRSVGTWRQLLDAWERTLGRDGPVAQSVEQGGSQSQGRRFDPCPAHFSDMVQTDSRVL